MNYVLRVIFAILFFVCFLVFGVGLFILALETINSLSGKIIFVSGIIGFACLFVVGILGDLD